MPVVKRKRRELNLDDSDERLEVYTEQLKELYDELVKDGGSELAALAILQLTQETSITMEDLRKLRASSPSFCAAQWDSVAPSLGLRADIGISQLGLFTVPIAILPPSFHRDLMKTSLRWMDVYQEPENHNLEEARVHLLEAVRMSDFPYVHL